MAKTADRPTEKAVDKKLETHARACPNADQSTCGSPVGPKVNNSADSSLLGLYNLQTPPTANYDYAGVGHLGYAAGPSVVPFGRDVFNNR